MGKEFDALRINTKVKDSACLVFKKDSLSDIIQKFLYTGTIVKSMTLVHLPLK